MFGITLADVKSFLGIADSDHTKDAYLNALLSSAISALQRILGRNLIYGAYRDTFMSFPTKIYLREKPVTSVFKVYTDSNTEPETSYKVFKTSGLIQFRYHRPSDRLFLDGGGFAYVDYIGGYTTLPGDMWMSIMNGIQAANNSQNQISSYGAAIKRISVYDVGVTDFATGSSSMSVMSDTMSAQLVASGYLDEYTIGTPNLHESEYLGPASLFSPSELSA